MVSRRLFLAITGGTLLTPRSLWEAKMNAVPDSLDHILLGCKDLESGIAFVEQRTGVRAAMGGVHPGRGTRNALLALGGLRYLEIIAPDAKQEATERSRELQNLSEPRLIGWAAHPDRAAGIAERFRKEGIQSRGPTDGSRVRPDGRTLHWKTVNLEDNRDGLLPFFIEWSKETEHPSTDAPGGCRLTHFGAVSPDPEELAGVYRRIGIEISIERGERAGLRARIRGPRGEFAAVS